MRTFRQRSKFRDQGGAAFRCPATLAEVNGSAYRAAKGSPSLGLILWLLLCVGLGAAEPEQTGAVRVAAYNVEFGKSTTPEQVGEMFKPYDLDIIGFNEAPNGDWTARVGKVLGMPHAFVGEVSSANHKDKYKTILSKTPLTGTQEFTLSGKGWSPASTVRAETTVRGVSVAFYSLHISRSGASDGHAHSLATEVLSKETSERVIVLGDFNNQIGDPAIDTIEAAGYRSTWTDLEVDVSKEFTYNALNPKKNLGVIDHIFYRSSDGVAATDGGIIELEKPLSDHKPVWAEIAFAEKPSLKVMSYNLYRGGTMHGQPLSQTAKVIQAAQADIVGIQETRSPRGDTAEDLAKLLGWNLYSNEDKTSIVTRYEIVEERFGGIKIRMPSGQEAYVFSLHLPSHPYQPYQLLGIKPKWHKHHDLPFIKTEAEAIAAATEARTKEVARLLRKIRTLPDQDTPVFVVGDFNEPSHLDWTQAAAQSGRHPIKVAYPTSQAMHKASYSDAWRTIYPDEMAKPGFTWSPMREPDDPTTHYDRIDFVYYKGAGVTPISVEIVGENQEKADIVVTPYPSDHRAVVATFRLDGEHIH